MGKIMNIEESVTMIPDGSTLAIGGLSMNSSPMALVREIARQQKKDLNVVAIVNGMAVDWLIAAGCVSRLITGLISFEGLGLAPNFRRAVEAKKILVEEYSEYILIARLRAAATNLPFIPTKAGLGTDVIALHPETTRLETDLATGEAYVACTPLPIDVAIVHAHAADEFGNVRVDPKLLWMDNEIVNAAETTIVTVENIIPHDDFVAEPHRTTYPRFMVDAVVNIPRGAYPASCYPDYTHDKGFYTAYSKAAKSPDTFQTFWTEQVIGPDTHADFIKANDGVNKVVAIRKASMNKEVEGANCSIDELMVVTLARQFNNTTKAFNGAVSFIPVCAYLLARKTHAPELVWAAASIAIDANPAALGESTLSDSIWDGAAMLANSPFDFWAYAQGQHYNTFAFRGAQIDRYGNVNNTVIGSYEEPKIRLPGGGGMADLGCMIPNIYLWSTTHNPRIFVEKLDFRSGIGWGDGGKHRQELGLPGGPQLCVTNLCVMDFHPDSKVMRLKSLHPEITLNEVQQATGFDLLLPEGDVPVTELPGEEELRILREEVDPTSMRLKEF